MRAQSASIEMTTSAEIPSNKEEYKFQKFSEVNLDIDNRLEEDNNAGDLEGKAKFATTASWIVNWFLFIVKLVVAILSSSKAVLAALVDSAVDLISQGILSMAELYMSRHSPDYPIGRSRLEAISVLACAFIMCMASVEVIQFSIVDIYNGLTGQLPRLEVGVAMYSILTIGIALKIVLYIYCVWAKNVLKSDMLEALAEDHFNDVISNSVAIVTAAIAFNIKSAWWSDPFGAILISIVIIGRWSWIIYEQIKKIVGHTAPPEFIREVEEMARAHDTRIAVDCTRAYHFGARFNVEIEVVLPGTMTVAESHDIALALQHKIEEMDDVERAFVHVDHLERDGLEHKVERNLIKGSGKSSSSPPVVDNGVGGAVTSPAGASEIAATGASSSSSSVPLTYGSDMDSTANPTHLANSYEYDSESGMRVVPSGPH